MLDIEIKEQLRSVFEKLESDVTLKVASSNHPVQAELLELLRDLEATSARLRVEVTEEATELPCVEILTGGRSRGIRFTGVPGGHEFSSLVLAILHVDGKGRQPDDAMIRRIRSLKGP